MTDTVKLPGAGPVKKQYVIAGVGIVGGVLIYAYWKRSRANAAAAATTPTTPDPSQAIDPSTGLTYAEEAATGGVGYGEPGYGGFSGGGGGQNPWGYDIYGNPLPAPTGLGGGAITTNNEWATEAETVLQGAGVTLDVATTAVTRVLGGLSVTSQQKDYFLQAVGALGQPPQGYPQPIHVTDPGTGPGGGGGGTLPAPTGLRVTKTDRYHAWLSWNPVTGADDYRVYRSDAATNVGGTHDTSIEVSGLHPNSTYHFHVRAVDSSGHIGAASASVSARTQK